MAVDLAALLGSVPKLDTNREQIEYIRLDLIDSDPNNFYQLSDIDNLAANIELCGLQQPIRVRPIPDTDRYMIVSGHRRRAAIEMLAKDNPERWNEVSCIVEIDAASPALQQLRLIFANSSTRKMTDAEVAEQAAQVKALLYKLKEEGYEFPGRMRDHVAEIVKASKSKLARLEVIRKNLAAAWVPSWQKGILSENTAYELSKMPKEYQTLLFEEKQRTNANLKNLYADDVTRFAERCSAIDKQECKKFDDICLNYENKMRKAAVSDRWGWFYCDSKCCKDCPELLRCQRACPKLADTIKKMKADSKAAANQEKLKQAEKDRPVIEKISAIWQRFGLGRELACMDIDACKKALDIYHFPFDAEKTMQLECGEAKITPETKLPFGYALSFSDVSRIVALADRFECSVDWLFCRTDVKEMAIEGVSESGTDDPQFIPGTWYPASVEPPVGVPLVMIDSDWYVDNGKYRGCGDYTMNYGSPVIWWTLEPDPSASAAAPAVSGWRSGTPEAYGTYAAYVQVPGTAKPMLRELLWTGEEWLMFGVKIPDDVAVQCWTDRPEF